MRIASAEDADLLLRQSLKENGWGHIKATAYCMELAESLTKNGKMKTARFIYEEIQKSRTKKNEQHLQSAARNALQKL
jgi:phage host-nuclease inhibitor protein Gam